MDFLALPTEIQHRIIRLLDMEDLLNVAPASKRMWQVVECAPGKYWDGTLLWADGREYVYGKYGDYLVRLMYEPTLRMLFANSTVQELSVTRTDAPPFEIKAQRIKISSRVEYRLQVLVNHRPAGTRYRKVVITDLTPNPWLIEWLNEYADEVQCT
ncbi:unnamed protein product, partial [Mesorhabditis spiculigera]